MNAMFVPYQKPMPKAHCGKALRRRRNNCGKAVRRILGADLFG